MIQAIQLLVNVYKDLGTECNSDRGRSEAKEEKDNTEAKAEKKEKKWLTKEEFAKATGLDKDNPMDGNVSALDSNYSTYRLYSDPDEALEAVKENIAYNKASGGWEQLYGDGNQVVDNSNQSTSSDSSQQSSNESDVNSSNSTDPNTQTQQEEVTTVEQSSQDQGANLSDEEAAALRHQMNEANGGDAVGPSQLTPEEEEEGRISFSAE